VCLTFSGPLGNQALWQKIWKYPCWNRDQSSVRLILGTAELLNPLNPNPRFCGHDVIRLYPECAKNRRHVYMFSVPSSVNRWHRRAFWYCGPRPITSFQNYLRLISGQFWWIFTGFLIKMAAILDFRYFVHIYASNSVEYIAGKWLDSAYICKYKTWF
jgi:hypothetical protein